MQPEEITEEYLLTRAQEVITLGNQFLKVFDRFNKDMEPYEENVSALMEVDARFMNMEKEFKLLTQRLIIR
jgi:protein tyrosine/serine phosphatase